MSKGLTQIGFKALLVTQFLGAFNDNAFKLVIAFIAVDKFVTQEGGSLFLSLAGILFALPYFLFSTYAGYFADHFSKQKIIVVMKFFEIFIMVIGLLALSSGNIWVMLFVLFLLGTQSAFFSPSKYGILPEILSEEKLSLGNGLIQMWTFAAIILGQASGGLLTQASRNQVFKIAYVFIAIAILGTFTSLFVTKVHSANAKRPFQWNFLREVVQNFRWIKPQRGIFLSILGLMYFGFLGGLFHLNILLYARKIMGIEHFPLSVLLIILALGIGIGSILAGKLSDQRIEFGFVPLGAIGLSVFSIILGFVHDSYFQVAACLLLLGLSAGFFIIPLNAYVQYASPPDRRGQILATTNILTCATGMFACVMLFIFKDIIQFNSAQIFVAAGILTSMGAIYVCRLLPYAVVRLFVWVLAHTIYRIRMIDKYNVPNKGGALLVSNHVAFVDAILLVVTVQRPIRFLVNREIYHTSIFRSIFKLGRAIPVSRSDSPKEIVQALNTAREAIKAGELVCIFPEGQLTRTGNILKFNEGLEHIVKGIDCPIIPIHLDRMWGSIFSWERGKFLYKWPKIVPYPVTISFGKALPSISSAFEIRARIMELGADAFQYRLEDKLTLPESFWREARKHPFKFCMADSSGKKLNYGFSLISAVAIAKRLRGRLDQEKTIGILIPPSVGGALVNIAVSILNKVPVNMNYTSPKDAIASIVKQCAMQYVITPRIFLEKTGIDLVCEKIFVEDIIESISKKDQIKALLMSFAFPSALSHRLIFGPKAYREHEKLATIMFTSGSTGEPKGVMLTHGNITSDLEGLYQVFNIKNDDIMLGILPFFHSFGFTGTLWFPLISGIGVGYHVNPLDAKVIGRLVQEHKATILMTTPTFLSAYIRRCEPEQFKSLRMVTVGAEKLKPTLAEEFKQKFGIEPMEGYGCTELSPVVSINLPDHEGEGAVQKAQKRGTIGLPLPGIAIKIIDQNTLQPLGPNQSGLLLVKGPNVMKGYLNQPEKTSEVIKDGWYFTGDVAQMDEDGFITITDRLSRFSKIGGEMVPHIKIEEAIHKALNSSEQIAVVTSIPDDTRGEKLVVLSTKDMDAKEIRKSLMERGIPNLWLPAESSFFRINSIPLLGTGKLDLRNIKRMASELAKTNKEAG